MRYIIALYEIDRAYGGSEEGGWHFDTGTLDRILALAPTEDRALALAERAIEVVVPAEGDGAAGART